jgi:DNA-binding transcriptional LysR family regulator
MDKLDAMRSFVEVAASGSFSKAAEQLGISRIRITRDIQELEDWLQLRLLHRTTRRVSLTSAGQDALLYCERILHQSAGLQASVRAHSEELLGEIRIASPIGLGQHLLLALIDEFCALHPKVTFHLLLSDKNAQLVDERIDIALRFTSQPEEQLIARRLMGIDSVICAAPAFLAKHGSPQQPQELSHYPCLTHLNQQEWLFSVNGEPLHVPVSGPLNANDMGVILAACVNGMGITRVTCDLANGYLRSGQLVRLLNTYVMPQKSLWAVYLSRSYQQPVVRAFIDFAAQHWAADISPVV